MKSQKIVAKRCRSEFQKPNLGRDVQASFGIVDLLTVRPAFGNSEFTSILFSLARA